MVKPREPWDGGGGVTNSTACRTQGKHASIVNDFVGSTQSCMIAHPTIAAFNINICWSPYEKTANIFDLYNSLSTNEAVDIQMCHNAVIGKK